MRLLTTFSLIVFVGAVAAGATQAQTWSREGPYGSVERDIDGTAGTATVSRSLENGATANRTTSCNANPWVAGCSTSIDVESQLGNPYSAERSTLVGPFRGRSVTSVTGPEGDTYVLPRHWRR